jgi:hypothetical protein
MNIYKLIGILGLIPLAGCSTSAPSPRVVVDSPSVQKTEVFSAFIGGTVKHVQKGDYHSSPGEEIAVLGQTALWLLDAQNYALVETDDFGGSASFGLSPTLVDAKGDGSGVVMMGGGGFGEVGLIDRGGKQLWTFQPDPTLAPTKMISGDLNEDGMIEFYVADSTGLYQVSPEGVTNWMVGNRNFYDVAITPEKTVLALDDARVLTTIDFEGNVVGTIKYADDVYNIDVVQWPEKTGILTGYIDKKVRVRNLLGELVFEYRLDDFPLYHAPQGIAVHLAGMNKPPYLAVLAHSRSSIGLSQLTIFTPSGNLLYQEILESTRGMCANDNATPGQEVLLVGNGAAGLIEYRLKQELP